MTDENNNMPPQLTELSTKDMRKIKALEKRAVQVDPPSPEKDRVSVSLSMHYQQFGEDATSATAAYSYVQAVSEQPPYQRWLWIGETWIKLDTGWVDEVGCLLLESRVGKGLNVGPSSEQKEEFAKQIIEVATDDPHEQDVTPLRIAPGRALLNEFGGPVYLRCLHGRAKVNVTAFPKG